MSIFKRGGAEKYYIQFNYNGNTYCRSSKTTNKRTAERMEREWKNGDPGSPTRRLLVHGSKHKGFHKQLISKELHHKRRR